MPDGAAYNVWVQSAGANSFRHTASAATILSNFSYLDHPLLNGNPNATILIANEWGRACCPNEFGRLGVFYENFANQWAIFTQDTTPLQTDSLHHVTVPEPDVATALALGLLCLVGIGRRRSA